MHKSSVRLVALLMAGGFCSCAYPGGYQAQWLNQWAAPRHNYSSSFRHGRRSEHTRIAHLRSRRGEPDYAATVKATVPSEDSTVNRLMPPALASRPHSTVTLAGDSRDRQRAQALLRKTDVTLLQARRHPLNGAEKENYERASQLAGRARRALAADDYTAASSLAMKAWSLSAGMSGQ